MVPRLHDNVLAWRGESSMESPDPYSAVVLTNFSWHWHGEKALGRRRALPRPARSFSRSSTLSGSETDRICVSSNRISSVACARLEPLL